MPKTPWNRVILEEFVSLALLTEEEEKILRTRIAGYSQVQQSLSLHLSTATVERIVRKMKEKYIALVPYSDKLPIDLDF
jgi:DNA-binding NarL/FixJ family response regulator